MTPYRRLSVQPGVAGSARLDEPDDAGDADDTTDRSVHLRVETVAVGICGTDAEIIAGHYGQAPPGTDRLVLGHEAVGRVTEAPADTGLTAGQLVVPIVRRPDPVPCPSCAAGEWDMCQNGRYREHGIKGAHGFARTRFTLDPAFAVGVPEPLGELAVLVEPASIVAKAWEQIERIGQRAHWEPGTVLVTGAGPVGLLAALMSCQRGFDTHVLDRVDDGPKPALVADLGASYHTGALRDVGPCPDVVIECTGVGALVLDAMEHTSPTGIVCLAGLSSGARTVEIDAAALNRSLVLENDVVFGTVNANRRHYEAAVRSLTEADRGWLTRLITRHVALTDWADALTKRPDDIKVVIDPTR
jgi:threonine dehydrogenase-like Zn-dependent dehydrogenase